ncbi:MAG: tetratricopeptide repeat protein [Chloroflexi bacterium]|nr:tetratricopeptide repeat protein [Chloroflexota bacterium]
MNKHNFRSLLSDIPKWAKGVIALATTIITFAILVRENYHLSIVVVSILLIFAGFVISIYVLYARTPPLIDGGKGVHIYEKYHIWAYVGLLFFFFLSVFLLWNSVTRNFISAAFSTSSPKYSEVEIEAASETIINSIPQELDGEIEEEKTEAANNAMGVLLGSNDLSVLSNATETYYRMGNYYFINGEIDSAIEMYEKTISLDPAHYKSYFNMARALEESERWSEAIKIYQQAQNLNVDARDHVLSLINLAVMSYSIGDYQNVLPVLEDAIDYDPLFAPTYELAGRTAIRLGDTKHALQYWGLYVELVKNDDITKEYYYQLLESPDEHSSFDLVEISSSYYLAGAVALSLGNTTQAKEYWAEFVELASGDDILADLLAEVSYEMDRIKE